MSNGIFRKVAIERLSSPEQLDMMMRITTPKGWLVLLTICGLLICVIVWGIFGTIPDKISGQGILMKSGGVFNIVADSVGRVQNLYFDVDDVVHRGQIVARLEQRGILDQIKTVRAKLQGLISDRERIKNFGTKEMELETESMYQQKKNFEQNIQVLEEQMKWLEKKLENQKTILEKGLITKQQFINTQEELSLTKQKIREVQNKLQQISIRKVQLNSEQQNQISAIDQKINETRRNLEQLLDDLNDRSKVVSAYTGRILEVSVDEGTLVNPGQLLLSIELMGKEIKNLEAVLYFPPTQGKSIRLGMEAQISPSTVKQEKYGFIKGMVTYVSEFPSTAQGMMRYLQNEALVRGLSQGGAPIEVHADLIPDPRTISGYKWSSSSGPPMSIDTGTLTYATVTISKQRPINLVIPIFKKYILGIGQN